MTLVGRKAPDFTVPAVMADGSIEENWQFYEQTKGQYKILLFYPLDFTFVCPSELLAAHNRSEEFAKRNASIVTMSVDSHFTHAAWRKTPVTEGGVGAVNFTMASDLSHDVMRMYGVELMEAKVALRASFIIDQAGIVQAQLTNNLPLGRNMGEILRLLDALQFHEQHGEVCPAGWSSGDQGMTASAEGVAEYLGNNAANL